MSPSTQSGFPVRALAAAAAALLALLGPAHSLAGGRAPARPPALASAAFTLAGSNGFAIDVAAEAGVVTVVASERRPPIATFSRDGRPRAADTGNGASSIYYARGRAAASRVDARLGGLGSIAVAFQPTGERRVTVLDGGSCGRPVRIVRRLGTFTGTIRFRGEDGYTEVEASRARGSVGTPLPACAGASAAARPRPATPAPGSAVLRAADRRAGTSFEAETTANGVAFRATLEERLADGLVVVRRAYAGAPRRAFAFNRGLTWARVKPPAPFSGVAHIEAGGPGRDAWKGNLRATFPGQNVPMTGAAFRASLRERG